MREAATCRRGNENAGLGTNRFTEYLRRFPKDMPFELIEIRPENAARMRTSSAYSTKRVRDVGGRRQKPHCHPRYSRQARDTPQLAAELERWKLDGRDVVY